MFISRRRLLQSSLLCAAGMVQGSSRALAQEPAASPTPNERKRMAGLAADFMSAYNVPGLSVAVAMKGKPAYVEAYGVADRETGEALTPQHRFRIASISKPITSTGIFTLIEAGKLRLGDYIFGPDSILGADYQTPPTVQSLMTADAWHMASFLDAGEFGRCRGHGGRFLVSPGERQARPGPVTSGKLEMQLIARMADWSGRGNPPFNR
jgi:CubicO group peptidase (beta-lactamase class C family)